MRRRDKASGKAVKTRRQKTSMHRSAPKTVRRHSAVSADLQDQLDRRTRELNEALEQQTATYEVLRVISSSSGKLAPVFESLLASAKHLCGADFGIILLREGDVFRTVALHGATAEYTEARWRAPFIRPPCAGADRSTRRRAQQAFRSDAEGRLFDRRHRNRPPGSAPFYKKASRAAAEPHKPSSPSKMRGCSTISTS